MSQPIDAVRKTNKQTVTDYPFTNSSNTCSAPIEDTMKFNFPKRLKKKNEVFEDTRVTRVRIISEKSETPPNRSPSITRPANEIAKNVQVRRKCK